MVSDQGAGGEPTVNGDAGSDVNGDGGEKPPSKYDIITITGKEENCERAKAALLVCTQTSANRPHGRALPEC